MNLNIPIYQHIRENGLKLTSPSVAKGREASAALSRARQALKPLSEHTGLDLSLIDSSQQLLNDYETTTTSSTDTIASRANDSLRLGSLSRYVNQIDAAESAVPSSCYNTEAAFSSVLGSCDDAFDSIIEGATQVAKAIGDYVAGSSTAKALESVLSGLGDLFGPLVKSIGHQLSKEADVIKSIEAKVKASSMAQSIAALWKDPCTQVLMQTTLPDVIQGHLA